MGLLEELVTGFQIPKMALVEQKFHAESIPDFTLNLLEQLKSGNFASQIKPGATVAITGGSRGIYGIDKITRTIVDFLKSKGAAPFIISAMGSHGASTIQGQLDILDALGINPETMGVDVVGGTDVEQIGQLEDGTPVYIDKIALNADFIVPVNRIKPHTVFRGKHESGLAKILSVGLGNHHGANTIHGMGLGKVSGRIGGIAAQILSKTNVLFGVAIVENARDEICIIEAVPPEKILERDSELLEQARSMMPRIYFDNIDIIIIDRFGKNISGNGMDPNIVGGFLEADGSRSPRPQFIVVLDLTEESHGAASGIGEADIITRKFFEKINLEHTYANNIVTNTPTYSKIPMVIDNDKLAVQAAIKMLLDADRENPRIVRIRDTLSLSEIWVSEAMMAEAASHPMVEIIHNPSAIEFTGDGNFK